MERLCEAAITGDTDSLLDIVENDPNILHKIAAGCFNSATSPLHVATSCKQTDFVKALLSLEPDLKLRLTEVLDSQLRSALHLASAQGHDEIVRELVNANPKMCLVRDRDGKNPVHVAAMQGNVNVLEVMVKASPQAARVRVDQNETILHLCVKHNQPESLKKLLELIPCREFVNAKDTDENTILHLAIMYKNFEVTRCILEEKTVDVNATNANGHTAMDILLLASHHDQKEVDHIEDLLRLANAKRAKDFVAGDWLAKRRDTLMVVASLIATMAFAAALTPPGGVWPDNSDGHEPGRAVMADTNPYGYISFLFFNTISLVASLSTIKLLISGVKFKNKFMVFVTIWAMCSALTSVIITFLLANVATTPTADIQALKYVNQFGVILWEGVTLVVLLYHMVKFLIAFVKEKRSKHKAIRRISKFKTKSSLELVCVKDGEFVRDRGAHAQMEEKEISRRGFTGF